ncbi:MAG: 6-phosphofructokinase isozyme 1 [Tenericutes bacterium ADurb.Bin239]|nr:MAG: 6-phosphofructokinase isozyme 1 [Tenericutes bacterium ADurb.Bin239]
MSVKVAVLTSGGDAPGMNAAIRAVIRSGLAYDFQMFAIFEGFRGIIENKIVSADRTFVSEIIMRGGTILKTARFPEFYQEETLKKAAENLKFYGITHLIVIGGDGSYRGAYALSKHGIKVIGIPATIDNDVMGTEQTIGFDTALNTITEAVDKLRDTSSSHHRCSIIEVMGNRYGDLALYSGTACGVDLIISPEHRPSEEEIIETLKNINLNRARHALVIVSEKQFEDLNDLKDRIIKETGFDAKIEVLGRLQRGGSPSASDRVLAGRLGVYAVDLIANGIDNVCVGLINGRLRHMPIQATTKSTNPNLEELINVIDKLK